MRVFYSISVWLYVFFVHVATLWNPKAKQWVQGRRESLQKLEDFQTQNSSLVTPDSLLTGYKIYWFHCASLGEFEQGRPLIEALKNSESCKIMLTFFSPSGYEIRKNYELADVILYLPIDSKKNAKRFFDLVKPDKVFFIKYEFWANYIFEAEKRKIPFYSISAVFRKDQVFFKWYGGFMRSILKSITTIFVQDEASKKLLESIEIKSTVSGDTRYDRVLNNAKSAQRFELIDDFTKDHKILVCGSVWSEDLKVISNGINQLENNWKIIIAPHEIKETNLDEIERHFRSKKLVRYSQLDNENNDAKILFIDNIGMLMHLYGYGNLAYVGGAFKTGLHNILEPASFGLPVIFGPHHKKFPEAELFIQNGIGFSISNEQEFNAVLNHLKAADLHSKVIQFMNSKTGATKTIMRIIFS